MKIAIVRGSNMNPFEMQSYAPLASKYDITGYAAFNNHYDIDDIGFTVKRLHIAEEYYASLLWPLNSLVYVAMLPLGGNFKMFGLEKELADKDILHAAETYNGYSYQCARLRKNSKKKLALTVWENIPFQSHRTFKGIADNGRIIGFVRENTDLFIAVTERAKKALLIEGVPEERIRVVPTGVDISRFKPRKPDRGMREKFGFGENEIGVLFIGRLEREKGVYDLLYAARLMKDDSELSCVKIALVGSGPEKVRLPLLAAKLGVADMVRFVGSISYKDAPAAYNAADAFILPSIPMQFWQEQFGMVLIEAMASGLPVISTMSGSIPEVVGDAGILIQPNDPSSIYQAVAELASGDEARRRLGIRARKHVEDMFDKDKISKNISLVYDELSA